MILAGVDVRLELRTVRAGGSSSVYDNPAAVYDGVGVYDGGEESWLDLNPAALYSTSDAPLNMSMSFEARCWDPSGQLDPSLNIFPELGQGSLVRLLADEVTVWIGRVGPGGVAYDFADLTCSIRGADNLAALGGWEIADMYFPVAYTAERVGTILDLLPGMVIPNVVLGTGQHLSAVQASGDAVSLLAELNRAELGGFVTDPDGTIRFVCRDALPPLTSPRFEFYDGDMGDGTYETLELVAPAVLNQIIADRVRDSEAEPSPQTFEDAASVSRYGPWSDTNTVLQFHDDSQVATWANLRLARGAYPVTVPSRASFRIVDDLTYGPRTLGTLLALRVLDAVRFHLTSRGDPRSFDAYVLGIAHDVTPDVWVVNLDLGAHV